jgi:hypothetical protein
VATRLQARGWACGHGLRRVETPDPAPTISTLAALLPGSCALLVPPRDLAPLDLALDSANCCVDGGNCALVCAPAAPPALKASAPFSTAFAAPTLCRPEPATSPRPPYRRRYVIPVRAGAERRALRIADGEGCGVSRWSIEEVRGVDHEGALPAQEVVIGGGGREGTLIVTRLFAEGEDACDPGWPPALLELPAPHPLLHP